MIIVEDGTNVTGGNSYCSVDEVQQAALMYLGVTFMQSITAEQLEQAIMFGHLEVKRYLRGKVVAKDPLDYPLTGTIGVPPAIKQVALLCCVLALLDDSATDLVEAGKLSIPGAWTFEPSVSNKDNKRVDLLKGRISELMESVFPGTLSVIRVGRVTRC